MEGIGELVRKLRAELGLTQRELADRAGLARDFIGQIETGKSQLPIPENRRKLAAGLGISHLDLLVAAGEIRADEIEPLKVQGVTPDDPVREALIAKLRRIRLDDPMVVNGLDGVLSLVLKKAGEPENLVEHGRGVVDPGTII